MRAAIAVLASGLVLQGCGAAAVLDDWHAHPTHAPLPAKHIEVADSDLNRVCGIHAAGRLYGCAIRVVEARVCIIYTAPQPAAWVMEHERKHCAGWDHGPTHTAAITAVAAVAR